MNSRRGADHERPAAIRLIAHPRHPAREVIERVAAFLARGGVAAFPTETLYGVGGMYASEEGARRVRALKGLEPEAPLVLLAPDFDWVLRLAELPAGARGRAGASALMERFWPGPLTLILPASAGAPRWLVSPAGGIALRIPGPSAAAMLTTVLGAPVVATSANRHGEPPAVSGEDISAAFGADLDVILDGGALRGENPSTLVNLTGARPRLVRAGTIGADELTPWIDPMDEDRMTASIRRTQVLFVCSGNTCRSPLAAAILTGMLPDAVGETIGVVSAGAGAISGAPASTGSLRVAAANGLSLDQHRSQRLTRDLVGDSDLIVVMEAHHRAAVLALDAAAGERTHLLQGLAAGLPPGEGDGVDDPMGGAVDAYERTFRQLQDGIRAAMPAFLSASEGAP